jgi:hypothetical protein
MATGSLCYVLLPVLADDVGHRLVQRDGLPGAGLQGSLGVLDVVEG